MRPSNNKHSKYILDESSPFPSDVMCVCATFVSSALSQARGTTESPRCPSSLSSPLLFLLLPPFPSTPPNSLVQQGAHTRERERERVWWSQCPQAKHSLPLSLSLLFPPQQRERERELSSRSSSSILRGLGRAKERAENAPLSCLPLWQRSAISSLSLALRALPLSPPLSSLLSHLLFLRLSSFLSRKERLPFETATTTQH